MLFEIWQVLQHHCYQDACQISEQSVTSDHKLQNLKTFQNVSPDIDVKQ